MLPEVGLLLLIVAMCAAGWQLVAILYRADIIKKLALLQIVAVFASYAILTICFVVDDFSVQYVAHSSNSTLPWYYKITAVWGAHEGSLLLWIVILNIWYLALYFARFKNAVLVIMGFMNLGLLSLLVCTSNSFLRYAINPPLDGADLNPMLQDFAMIIHPPVLYVGYVGTAAAFAITIAHLWQRDINSEWARIVRPWAQVAWIFLTLGITLGSWWAYYELGWGGWWFWDPVENASFMPWLTATALLHCLAIASREPKLLGLAVFLTIITFALSIFGTFLVRSGAISSVHAFANDPKRGMFILQFLAILLGGALLLFAMRFKNISSHARLTKRDIAILGNNVLLLIATACILFGTLLPLLYDLLFKQPIAIGVAYFNAVFLPIMLLLSAIMLPSFLRWRNVALLLIVCCIMACVFLYAMFQHIHLYAALAITLAISIMVASFNIKKLAMSLAHIGLAVTIVGIAISANYENTIEQTIKVGEQVALAKHTIQLQQLHVIDGPNYIGYQAKLLIDAKRTVLPERRMYLARELVVSETGILPGLTQDIYVILGQQIADNSWSFKMQCKPFVRWIWLGAIIMTFAGCLSFCMWQTRSYK